MCSLILFINERCEIVLPGMVSALYAHGGKRKGATTKAAPRNLLRTDDELSRVSSAVRLHTSGRSVSSVRRGYTTDMGRGFLIAVISKSVGYEIFVTCRLRPGIICCIHFYSPPRAMRSVERSSISTIRHTVYFRNTYF